MTTLEKICVRNLSKIAVFRQKIYLCKHEKKNVKKCVLFSIVIHRQKNVFFFILGFKELLFSRRIFATCFQILLLQTLRCKMFFSSTSCQLVVSIFQIVSIF